MFALAAFRLRSFKMPQASAIERSSNRSIVVHACVQTRRKDVLLPRDPGRGRWAASVHVEAEPDLSRRALALIVTFSS